MNSILPSLPFLSAMAVLIFFSAFFSSSEAALFSLRRKQRKILEKGNLAQSTAARLLQNPDRLLSAILFWNLVINLLYFVLGSIVSLKIEKHDEGGSTLAAMFAIVSLLMLIFCCEMLPKTVGVLLAIRLTNIVSLPLSVFVKLVDPIIPLLLTINRLSQRAIWPAIQAESKLDIADLERAILLSVKDAQLMEQETAVLKNIVQLSDIRADEWMRPRSHYQVFRPPVSLADLEGKVPPSGYLLIAEPDSDELEYAVRLHEAYTLGDFRLEQRANRVLFAPWCSTMAEVLDKMRSRDRDVTGIVNEHGETIGVLTIDDIMEAVFTYDPSRSKTVLDQKPIHHIRDNLWLVSGMTSVRKLEEFVDDELPRTKNLTVGGVIQESLQRIAAPGDECEWGRFKFKVLEMPQRGHLLIEMSIIPQEDGE